MVNLCIDIGNTLSKLAVFENNEMTSFEILEVVDLYYISCLTKKKKVSSSIISSVSRIPDGLTEVLQKDSGYLIILSQMTPVPVQNCYDTPETLGKDRLAAVVGASFLFPGEDLLVIDAGTAITYDLINSQGHYLGGNISPGINLRFKALNHFTSKLPLVERQENFPMFGKNTHDAILCGVLHGMLHEVDGTIHSFRQSYPGLKVLFTGGDAKFFDYKLKNAIFVVSNLVMIGLNRILEYNAQKL